MALEGPAYTFRGVVLGSPWHPWPSFQKVLDEGLTPIANHQRPNGSLGGLPGALLEHSRSPPMPFLGAPRDPESGTKMAQFQIAQCDLEFDARGIPLGAPREPKEASQLGLKIAGRSSPRWPGPPGSCLRTKGAVFGPSKLPGGLLCRPGPSRGLPGRPRGSETPKRFPNCVSRWGGEPAPGGLNLPGQFFSYRTGARLVLEKLPRGCCAAHGRLGSETARKLVDAGFPICAHLCLAISDGVCPSGCANAMPTTQR